MEIFGKNIKLFLVDGTPNGKWICELSNWTGIAYKIPRNSVKDSDLQEKLSIPGVYFLFGRDIDGDTPIVYVGEAENLFERFKEHLFKKDYWTEVIVLASKDDHLNKAHIKYLENRFYETAKECKRYIVMNSVVPTKSSISSAEKAEMEEFIYNAKILVSTLGHKAFEPIAYPREETGLTEKMLYLNANGINAYGLVTSEGFVVLKGSTVNKNNPTKSAGIKIMEMLKKYKSENKVTDFIVQEDLLFSSSSAAGAFLLGYSISGPKAWKNADGVTLKEIEER